MQRIAGLMRSAIHQYNMIEPDDRIAVGVSGGKDSMALLTALASLRGYYPHPFSLVAITLDPCFNNTPTDYSAVEAHCASLGVPFICKPTRLGEVIFEYRKEKNPCSLCAKLRRGILHNAVLEAECNRLALGHHLDDAAETFLMNLLYGGTIGCFSPVTWLDRKQIHLIRPMVFAEERWIAAAVRQAGIPVVKSMCPVDGETARAEMKTLLQGLDTAYGQIKTKILGALQRGGLNGWGTGT